MVRWRWVQRRKGTPSFEIRHLLVGSDAASTSVEVSITPAVDANLLSVITDDDVKVESSVQSSVVKVPVLSKIVPAQQLLGCVDTSKVSFVVDDANASSQTRREQLFTTLVCERSPYFLLCACCCVFGSCRRGRSFISRRSLRQATDTRVSRSSLPNSNGSMNGVTNGMTSLRHPHTMPQGSMMTTTLMLLAMHRTHQ